MRKKASLIRGWSAAIPAGLFLPVSAVAAAAPAVQGAAGHHLTFLFDRFWWLVLMAAGLGLLWGGLQRRRDPFLDGDRVLRHDSAARLSHWTHAIGCVLLLLSGFGLGFFLFPRWVAGPDGAALMMNLHFCGALLFVFGGFYWLANTIVSPWRLREHLPERGSLAEGVIHYAHILGLTRKTVRPAKYDGSERLAFLPIVIFALLLIGTGFVKLAARFSGIPTEVLAPATQLHDISALVMLLLFCVHVLLGAVVPWSWPLLGSMFSGWVSRDFARRHHPRWFAELEKQKALEGDET